MAAIDVANRAIPLEPGSLAPDFELQSTPSQTVRLSELRGQPVVLVFYPETGARSAATSSPSTRS